LGRLQKTLEDANIKLDSVISDVMGLSGRTMVEALIAGESDPDRLALLAHRRIKAPPQARASSARPTSARALRRGQLIGLGPFGIYRPSSRVKRTHEGAGGPCLVARPRFSSSSDRPRLLPA